MDRSWDPNIYVPYSAIENGYIYKALVTTRSTMPCGALRIR